MYLGGNGKLKCTQGGKARVRTVMGDIFEIFKYITKLEEYLNCSDMQS